MPAPSRTIAAFCLAMLLLLATPDATRAQSAQSAPIADASRPFEIADNSFLVEEAFNQPAGVFQNIFGLARSGGTWARPSPSAIFRSLWAEHPTRAGGR